jgi:hypothetical protein
VQKNVVEQQLQKSQIIRCFAMMHQQQQQQAEGQSKKAIF